MMKVLIADHDQVSRQILGLVFDEWGHDVMTAPNSGQALNILRLSEAPSLVISDTIMPEADGLKLCGKIRGENRNEDPYFFYSYSKEKKNRIIKPPNADIDGYLNKPFEQNERRCDI
jgi:CheY-like chemotaxis protein